jgi:uncharacterized protein with HEPN domain
MIKIRFKEISSSEDFLKDDDGLMRLDSISMRLQAIGEALRNIDKRYQNILLQIATKEYWSNIIKTRDILSHHYIDIDSEIIYMICNEKLYDLESKINQLEQLIDI